MAQISPAAMRKNPGPGAGKKKVDRLAGRVVLYDDHEVNAEGQEHNKQATCCANVKLGGDMK